MSTAVPEPSTPAPARKDRRGLIALILGVLALILAFVPYASYGAWLLGIAAVVVGILAIVRPGSRKPLGIVAIVLGALAVLMSLIMSIVYTVLFALAAAGGATPSGYASQSDGAPVGGSGTTHRVVYSVTGSGRASAIAYYSVVGGQSGQSTLQDQRLPWSKEVTVRGDLTSASSVLTVVGQRAGSGAISCTITLDGKTVSSQSADGASATAQCIYRPTD